MSGREILTVLVALVGTAALGAPAALAQDDDLAPLGPVSATYDVTLRGSVSVDWSRKSGEVDKQCAPWSDESGSSTLSFAVRRTRVITVSAGPGSWRFGGFAPASTKQIRSWKRRYGSADTAGCPGVCPPGTTARAADGTCEPAKPAPGKGRDDCGTRKTARTSLTFNIEPREEDDDDLAELVFNRDPPATFAAGPPLFQKASYRQCKVYGENVLTSSLPIRMTTTDVRGVRQLAKGRSKRFRATKTDIDCASKGDRQSGTTCVVTYDLDVRIRRVR